MGGDILTTEPSTGMILQVLGIAGSFRICFPFVTDLYLFNNPSTEMDLRIANSKNTTWGGLLAYSDFRRFGEFTNIMSFLINTFEKNLFQKAVEILDVPYVVWIGLVILAHTNRKVDTLLAHIYPWTFKGVPFKP